MGALHEGHLSLVRSSLERCDVTVVSIFVNPTQFAPNEDFQKYPRTLDADVRLLDTVGETIVFAPCADDIYPDGYDSWVDVGGVTSVLEGAIRPGHFRGVATIVLKLFLMTSADEAFFGQKDYQQATVISQMIRDFNVPITMTLCPIVRESDGLAMSSRNSYLLGDERSRAVVLSRSLAEAERMITEQRCRDANKIVDTVKQMIQTENGLIDYVTVTDRNLKQVETIDTEVVILVAVRFGTTRLIDNTIIEL
jgi:pantoate--beta-alanine ligase